MDNETTNESSLIVELGKTVAIESVKAVAEVATAYALLAVGGLTYLKIKEIRETRAAKKSPQTED